MAASQEQKVDFLLKKIGYVASKTGIAEDSSLSGTKKAPFGEAIPSPLVTPASSVWAEAAQIPETPPGSDTSFVRVYLSGSSGHRMTVDSTVSGNRTFIARSTYNDNTTAILGDWIDPSFGSDYIVKVFRGDPNSGGVQLSAAGSGSNDTWFFDYSSGVLNFNGTSVPSGVTSTNIYIVGYRYIGIKGVAVPGAGTTFTFATIGDLNITGVSTFFDTTDNTLGNENTGSVQLDGGMGIAKNLTVKQNLHVGGYAEFVGVATFKGGTINLGDADTDDINVGGEFVSDLIPDVDDTYSLGSSSKQWKNLFINGHAELDNTVISGVSTFSSPLDINTDVDIDGHTELDNVNIAGVTTFQSNAFFGDADYIQMGDSQDLKIGHVGSYSVILDQGEGNLSIGGDGFVDIMNTALDEYKARFTTNGSVELYFDNVNKFETTGYGATVFGTLQSQQLNVSGVSTFQSHVHLGDTDELRFGANNDFKIFHDPDDARIENSNGDIKFKNTGSYFFFDEDGGETLASFINDGAVNLYYNGSKKFETTPTGVTITDDLNVAGVSTFAGNINANGNIVGDNSTNISGINSVTAVTYFGDGSQLTGSGGGTLIQGISIEEEGSNVGTAGSIKIINFKGPGVTAASVNALKVDVTVDTGINTAGGSSFNNLNVTGVSTFAGNINANGNIIGDSATNISGINSVTATNYFGNGVNLSGIVTSLVAGANISISGATGQVTITGLANTANVTANTLVVSGFSTLASASFSGNVSIAGTLTYEDVTNIDSVGLITARAGIRIGTGGTVGPSGPGIVTYFGDGSQLSGVQGGKWEETDVGINTSSNVGIGTTNPVHKLEVLGDTNLTGNLNVVGITTINGHSVPSIGMVIALSGF